MESFEDGLEDIAGGQNKVGVGDFDDDFLQLNFFDVCAALPRYLDVRA